MSTDTTKFHLDNISIAINDAQDAVTAAVAAGVSADEVIDVVAQALNLDMSGIPPFMLNMVKGTMMSTLSNAS